MSSEGYQQNYSGEKLRPVANRVMLKQKLARPGIKKEKKIEYQPKANRVEQFVCSAPRQQLQREEVAAGPVCRRTTAR